MPHTQQRQIQFEQLVRQWSADLYRFAYWLSREQDLAEELVQETFTRDWKPLDQLQEPKAANSRLFTILRREYARRFERKAIPIAADCEPDTRPGKPAQDNSTEAFVLRQALQVKAPSGLEERILNPYQQPVTKIIPRWRRYSVKWVRS